ncbi:MAG TPA: hypothetical protein VKS78_07765, partial [Roseiarcus sp.]|nr:hypothetical protein [Roseiarcus sp.]
MILRAILVTAMMSPSYFSFGQERTPTAILGDGNVPCSWWSDARKGTDYASIKAVSTMTGWVEGYVTAASIGADAAGAKFSSMSADAVVSWIDDYCGARPADSLAQASAA